MIPPTSQSGSASKSSPSGSEVSGADNRLRAATKIIAALKDFVLYREVDAIFGKDGREWGHRAILWLLEEEPTTDLYPAPTRDLLTNIAQILDVVKIEWAESWSDWDQAQRDGITAWLTEYYRRAAPASPAPQSIQATDEPTAVWRLDEAQSEAFATALLEPAEPNAALREAAARYRAKRGMTVAELRALLDG